MTWQRVSLAFALTLALLVPAAAQTPVPAASAAARLEAMTRLSLRENSGTLFEFRTKQLPMLAEKFRDRARAAATLQEQRRVVQEFLSHIPASHLGLLSARAHRTMMADLLQVPYPSFGFQAIGAGPHLYAGMILQGGPAARAGLLLGDRLVTIDGVPVEQSPRLDWRTDDAYIGDERDPSVQYLLASASDRMELRVERRPGEFVKVSIAADEYTPFDAA